MSTPGQSCPLIVRSALLPTLVAFAALFSACVEAEVGDLDAAMQKETSLGECGDRSDGYGEVCDAPWETVVMGCEELGLPLGVVFCDANCELDTGHCVGPDVCGNGVAETGEECDAPRAPDTCEYSDEGPCIVCRSDCTWGPGSGPWCGDGVVNGPELCDGDDIASTCESLGWEGGELACDGCNLVTDGCTGAFCGDGVVEGAEDCDTAGMPAEACAYGTRFCTVCSDTCSWVRLPGQYCGDGIVTPDHEVCDPGRNDACTEQDVEVVNCSEDCQMNVVVSCEVPGVDADLDATGGGEETPADDDNDSAGNPGCVAAGHPAGSAGRSTLPALPALLFLAALLRRRCPTSHPRP